ncbi:MAG: tryptophan synthase subunit alpha [Bryobacteraceae bacterium]|nr:tryptophan synthase subunit alpha [Bryobacteraceae bacterium]
MSRISNVFARGRKVFVAYLTAGDPNPEATPELVAALERGGADLIELGVPFSDPIADGPVIQAASARALAAGTTLGRVLEIAKAIRERSEIPLLLFTYMNPVVRYGFEALARDAKAAGIDGCLITDLSVEEAEDFVGVMRRAELDTVFLAAPTSSTRRLDLVARYSTGFIYAVSRTGVTGEREQLAQSAAPLLDALRARTKMPLALGFGIANGDQARAAAAHADGVVVGSAIVRAIEKGADVEALARSIRLGLDDEGS